jgi:hypothetical protein
MKIRARYDYSAKTGLISVLGIINNKPVLFSLKLFDETTGSLLKLKKSNFPSIDIAISYATLHGFLAHMWEIEILD